MNCLIVEKTVVDISSGRRRSLFAVATSERVPLSVRMSLTHEAHLTAWTSDRKAAEDTQKLIEGELYHVQVKVS